MKLKHYKRPRLDRNIRLDRLTFTGGAIRRRRLFTITYCTTSGATVYAAAGAITDDVATILKCNQPNI